MLGFIFLTIVLIILTVLASFIRDDSKFIAVGILTILATISAAQIVNNYYKERLAVMGYAEYSLDEHDQIQWSWSKGCNAKTPVFIEPENKLNCYHGNK